jgi:hypothetical protein
VTVAALALVCAAAVPQADAFWLDMKGIGFESRITAICLQGVVNRDAPRLFLDMRGTFWPWPPSDATWREYLEKSKGFHFTVLPDLPAAIAQFRPDLAGLAVYDPVECDAERSLACTSAAIDSYLPVSAAMLAAQPKTFEGLAIKQDWRGKFKDIIDAYAYATKNIMPRCARGICYSLGHSFSGNNLGSDVMVDQGLDYVVSQRGFVLNLSPAAEKVTNWYNQDWAAHPDQAALFSSIVRDLGPLTQVWGWVEPEWAFSILVSRAGGVIELPGPNLSFWRNVPAGSPRLPTPPRRAHLEDKCYLVFQTNEGDALSTVCAFFNGAWMDKNHGSQPVAWGINPLIGTLFPALFEYFAATATPNDSFFCSKGAGYCFPNLLPRADLFYQFSERLARSSNVPTVDVWDNDLKARFEVFAAYHSDAPFMTGFTLPPGPEPIDRWLPDGTPVICQGPGLNYYSCGADGLAKQVRLVAADMPRPCFIGLYGGLGPGIYGLVHDTQALLGDGYEAVTMDDFMALAREAGRLVMTAEPRFVMRGEKARVALTWHGPELEPPPTAEVSAFGQKTQVRLADAAGETARGIVSVPADAPLGPQLIVATHGADRRSVQVTVVAEEVLLSDFHSRGGWQDVSAELSIDHGRGRVFCPPEHPYASVELRIAADFNRDPVLSIEVSKAEGPWALKANDGTMTDDRYLLRDNGATGVFSSRLCDALPEWHGRKSFRIILFAIGAGRSVWVDRLRLLYLR